MNKNMESKQYKSKSKYAPFFYKGKQGSLKHGGHGNDNGSGGGYNSNNNSGGGNYSVGNSSSYMYKKRYNNYNSNYDVKHNGGSSYNHDEIYGSERKCMNGAGMGGSHSGHSSRALYKYNGGNNSSSNTGNRYGSSSYAFKKREAKQVGAISCNGHKNESATDGNEESKNRCEIGEVDSFVSAAKNKANVHKDDSLNVQGNTATGAATTDNMNQGDGNKNVKDSSVHENIHDNNGSVNASREDNNSVGSAQGDRKGCYESKEYRDMNTNNLSSDKMINVSTPFCNSQEEPSHEKSFGERQENPMQDSSSSDENDSEDRNYMHDVAGDHDDADNYTETENEGAVSVASPFDIVDSVKDVGEKLTNSSLQSMEHKHATMDMVKNNIREIEHEYEENQTADEERGVERERFQGVDVFRDEESYVSERDDDSCERVMPHDAYNRESLVSATPYGQYVENGFSGASGKERERERNGRVKGSKSRGNERDATVHGDFMSRSEGNCSTRVKREAEIEEDEAGIYVSGEVARKRLKKFQRLHKIGKIKEKRNGDDVFNILVSAELNNDSSDVGHDGGCYEEENMDEYSENVSQRYTSYGIAYMFTFQYYHTLHKNKALMHNLYADDAILIISANSINLKILKHTLFRNKLGLDQENIFGVDVESVPFSNIENLYTEGVQVNDNMLKLTNKELIDGYFNLLDVDDCTVHILSLEVVNFNEDLLIYVYGKIKKGKSSEMKYHSFVQNIRLQKYNAYQYYVVLDFVHYYDSNTDDGFFVSTEEMKKMDDFQREQILKSISQKKSEILKMKKQLSRPLVSSNAVLKKKTEQKRDVAKTKKSGSTVKRSKKENSNVEAKTKGAKLKAKKDTTQKDEVGEQKTKDKNKKIKSNSVATETVVESVTEKMKKKLNTEDKKDEEEEHVVVKKVESESVMKAAEKVEAVEVHEMHEGIKEDTKKKETVEVSEQKKVYVDVVDKTSSEENKNEKTVEDVMKMEHLEIETKNNGTEGNKKIEKKTNETVWNKDDSKKEVSKSGDISKEESTSKSKQKKKKKEKTVDPNSWVFRVMKNSINVERVEGSKEGAQKETEQNNDKKKKEKSATDKKNDSYHNNSNTSADMNNIAEEDGESELQETTESNSEEEIQKKEREKIVSANEKKIIIHNVHKHMDKKKINDCIIERLKKYNDGHAVQIDIYERSPKKYFGTPYIYQYNSSLPNVNKNGSGTSGNVHASNNSDIKNSSEKINGVANANQPYGSSYERINIAEYSYAIAELDCRQSQQLLLDLGLYCNGIKLNIEQFKDKKKENSKFGKRFGGFGGYTNSNNNSSNINNSGPNEYDGSNTAAMEGKGKEDKMKSHFHRGKGERNTSSPIMQIPQVGMNSFRIRRGNDRGF